MPGPIHPPTTPTTTPTTTPWWQQQNKKKKETTPAPTGPLPIPSSLPGYNNAQSYGINPAPSANANRGTGNANQNYKPPAPTAPTTPNQQTVPWWKRLQNTLQEQLDQIPVGGTPSPYQPAGNVIAPPKKKKDQPNQPTIPTTNVIGGGQWDASGPGAPYNMMLPAYRDTRGTGNYNMNYGQTPDLPPSTGSGFGSSYGGNWRKKRGGGGYGGRSGWSNNQPWYLNLNSWNYGE